MVYLLYGTENYLIEKEIHNIINKCNIEDINISKYDLLNDNIKDVIDDALTLSLFASNKMIICSNAYIFSRKNVKSAVTQNLDILLEYLENQNPNTELVFILPHETIDSVKKITKALKKNGVIKDFNKEKNINSIVKDMFADYKIDYKTINLFIDRIGDNLELLNSEANKLLMYKYNEKEITMEDVDSFINKNIDLDIFKLIEAIINKNKDSAMEIYHEMLKYNEEPIKIIIMLANQIRIIYQSKVLYKEGYTEKDIAKKLGIHPYRIKLALQNASKYSDKKLIDNLERLADLDIQIKSGTIDKKLGLDLFILGF
jgi:DNA polymerase-3 subunit delta